MVAYKVRKIDGTWYTLGSGSQAKIRALDGSWYVENSAAPPEAKVRLLAGTMGPGVNFGPASDVEVVEVDGQWEVRIRGSYFWGYNDNGVGTVDDYTYFPNSDGFLATGGYYEFTGNGWGYYPDWPDEWTTRDARYIYYPWNMGSGDGNLSGGGGFMCGASLGNAVGYLQFASFTPPAGAVEAGFRTSAAWCKQDTDEANWSTYVGPTLTRRVQFDALTGSLHPLTNLPTSYVSAFAEFTSAADAYPSFTSKRVTSLGRLAPMTTWITGSHSKRSGPVARVPVSRTTGEGGLVYIKEVVAVFVYDEEPTL